MPGVDCAHQTLVWGQMGMITFIVVPPVSSQVALVHSRWQDYPEWHIDDTWVAYRAMSLINQDEPPYPGFAVATRPDIADDGTAQSVTVELWTYERPTGLRQVHQSIFSAGSTREVLLGNEESGKWSTLIIPESEMTIEILVDAERPIEVARVAFVLGSIGGR